MPQAQFPLWDEAKSSEDELDEWSEERWDEEWNTELEFDPEYGADFEPLAEEDPLTALLIPWESSGMFG